MFRVAAIRHSIAARLLKWWVVIKSHPLSSSTLTCLLLLVAFRRYLWIHLPIWLYRVSHPIFEFGQMHPVFGRTLHVLFNAIPDTSFMLLAVAGLAYLVPKRYLDKLEEQLWVRIFLIALFVTFGLSAIVINAIKSENQEYEDNQNKERMGVVLKSVLNIQEALKPKAINLTESERKEQLLESLRDEYIASHSSIDPEILAGKKMPPDDWLNTRLAQMGEKWEIHTPPPIKGTNSVPLPAISINTVEAQIPTKAGDDAIATIQFSVNGSMTKTVNMGQLTAIRPVSLNNPEAQRAMENALWNELLDYYKKSTFSSLELPANNKSLSISLKQKNVTQENFDRFKSEEFAFYFLVRIEEVKGKILLDSCFLVNDKDEIQYCREHNGP